MRSFIKIIPTFFFKKKTVFTGIVNLFFVNFIFAQGSISISPTELLDHYHINNSRATNHQNVKNGTFILFVEEGDDLFQGTGQLVKTITQQKKQYILTAGHLFQNEIEGRNMYIYITNEYEILHSDPIILDPNRIHCIAKKVRIKLVKKWYSTVEQDFALLEIIDDTLQDYRYYTGYTLNTSIIPYRFYSIGHPKINPKHFFSTKDIFIHNANSYYVTFEKGKGYEGLSGASLFNSDKKITGIFKGGISYQKYVEITQKDPLNWGISNTTQVNGYNFISNVYFNINEDIDKDYLQFYLDKNYTYVTEVEGSYHGENENSEIPSESFNVEMKFNESIQKKAMLDLYYLHQEILNSDEEGGIYKIKGGEVSLKIEIFINNKYETLYKSKVNGQGDKFQKGRFEEYPLKSLDLDLFNLMIAKKNIDLKKLEPGKQLYSCRVTVKNESLGAVTIRALKIPGLINSKYGFINSLEFLKPTKLKELYDGKNSNYPNMRSISIY